MFSFKSFIVPHPMFQSLIHFIFVYGVQASVVAQLVKNLPAMQEMQIQSLGWEHPLEEGMATHSSILAWRGSCHGQRILVGCVVHRIAQSRT